MVKYKNNKIFRKLGKARTQARNFIKRIYKEGLSEESADINIAESLIELAKKEVFDDIESNHWVSISPASREEHIKLGGYTETEVDDMYDIWRIRKWLNS